MYLSESTVYRVLKKAALIKPAEIIGFKASKEYRLTASPFHPQTNGKIERYHRTIKGEINRVPFEMPGELKEAIRAFIEYNNYRRYHEGLGNVTPHYVYTGKHLEIIQRRKEVKSRTLAARRDYNRIARKESNGP